MEKETLDKLVGLICKTLELKNSMSHKFIKETLEAIQTFDEKHTEKGLASYGEFGPIGVVIKLAEKFNTLKEYYTLLSSGNVDKDSDLDSDTLEKLWKDVSVYALMAKLVEEGEWG